MNDFLANKHLFDVLSQLPLCLVHQTHFLSFFLSNNFFSLLDSSCSFMKEFIDTIWVGMLGNVEELGLEGSYICGGMSFANVCPNSTC
jgi:hypothetical protein